MNNPAFVCLAGNKRTIISQVKRQAKGTVRKNKISSSGVMGDPTRASAEKGQKIWEIMMAHLVALVEDLKTVALDKIN